MTFNLKPSIMTKAEWTLSLTMPFERQTTCTEVLFIRAKYCEHHFSFKADMSTQILVVSVVYFAVKHFYRLSPIKDKLQW